jgi:hypothetical protein
VKEFKQLKYIAKAKQFAYALFSHFNN